MSAASVTQNDGAGIDIRPGLVVVDLATVDLRTLTRDDLADCFEDATGQLREKETHPLDDVGDIDNWPL